MKILMVCLGNICRSPLAEGITRSLFEERGLPWQVDSAGTGGWHEGEPPDTRSIITARNLGIDISQLKARRITHDDLSHFDLIVTMDQHNYREVRLLKPSISSKLHMILDFVDPGKNLEVPDPYYGKQSDFDRVGDLLIQACGAMINQLVENGRGDFASPS